MVEEPISKDVLQALDNGILYLTNQRLIFDGTKKNVSLPLKSITNFGEQIDGLQIEKGTGRDIFFRFTNPDAKQLELWGVMLNAAIRKQRG